MPYGELDFRNSRAAIPTLVVSPNRTILDQARLALKTIGFGAVSGMNSLSEASDKIRDKNYPLVVFDARSSDLKARDFVEAALKVNSSAVLIPFSPMPNVNDIFELLRAGAKHYISLPFDTDTIEDVVLAAAESPPLSSRLLNSPDLNSALAGVVLNSLDRISLLQHAIREVPSYERYLNREQQFMEELTTIAKTYCDGNAEVLLQKIMEECIHRAEAASTRLGRARAKLKQRREKARKSATSAGSPLTATR